MQCMLICSSTKLKFCVDLNNSTVAEPIQTLNLCNKWEFVPVFNVTSHRVGPCTMVRNSIKLYLWERASHSTFLIIVAVNTTWCPGARVHAVPENNATIATVRMQLLLYIIR